MFKFLKSNKQSKISSSNSAPSDSTLPTYSEFPTHWLRWLLVILGIAASIAVFAYMVTKLGNPHRIYGDIRVGDITITEQAVKAYAEQLRNYKTVNPDVFLGEDLTTTAIEDLVLNTALKIEARRLNIEITEQNSQDYDKAHYSDLALKERYQQYLEQPQISELMKLRKENELYKEKLDPLLLKKKDLLVVQIPYDTNFHVNKPAEEQKQLHQEAVAKLQNEFMPLIEQGKSAAEIEAKADVVYGNPDKQPVGIYEQRPFTYVQTLHGYPGENPINHFNDIPNTTEVMGFVVDNLYDTDYMVAQLHNVGDFTPVFASKAGGHMIIRLEGYQKGVYETYEKMLDDYRQRYVYSWLQKLNLQLTAWWQDLWHGVQQGGYQSLAAVSKSLADKVYATPPPECANHYVNFAFFSRDATLPGGPLVGGGAYINKHRNPSPSRCGQVSEGKWTDGGGVAVFPENCNQNAPVWSVPFVKPGYTLYAWDYPGWSTGLNSSGGVWSNVWLIGPPPNFNNNADLNANPYAGGVERGQTVSLTARISNVGGERGGANAPATWLRIQVYQDNTGGITNQDTDPWVGSVADGYSTTACTNYGAANRTPCFWWQLPTVLNGQTISGFPFRFTIPNTAEPGDQICLRAYAHAKANGVPEDVGNAFCLTVVGQKQPFVSTGLGSIQAGTVWGDNPCLVNPETDDTPGIIQGRVNPTLDAGSKGDYIVSAGGQILSFGSAGTPSGSSSGNLKFSSTTGGEYGQVCRPDLAKTFLPKSAGGNGHPAASSLGYADGAAVSLTMADLAARGPGIFTHTGTVTITGGQVVASQRTTLVVKGTVLIQNDVISAAGPFNRNNIPSLAVLATDNINVHENVGNLYGIFVAGSQLSSPGTGIINTCQNDTSSSSFNPQITLVNACNNPLRINGALIANEIYFRRKAGDVNQAGSGSAEFINLVPQLLVRPPLGIGPLALELRFRGERPPIF